VSAVLQKALDELALAVQQVAVDGRPGHLDPDLRAFLAEQVNTWAESVHGIRATGVPWTATRFAEDAVKALGLPNEATEAYVQVRLTHAIELRISELEAG
jgi:hypothetical protein